MLFSFFSEKDGETNLPSGTQSLSKATGAKFASGGTKSQSAKSKSGVSNSDQSVSYIPLHYYNCLAIFIILQCPFCCVT